MNPIQLKNFLDHVFKRNNRMQETGQRGTPIMIWGTHGLGKTEMVFEYARENGWKIAYCAPAQFEEMGDLHGMPMIMDPDRNVSGDEYTVYSPPQWIPKDDGPGILLLDDVNRADDRILRGIMQLLQHFELHSWKLPPRWQIIATANPDSGEYSVTPMDDAMLTRMIHVTLEFDARSWAEWATTCGIDRRGIDFVLTYPETVTGKRTTPRSIVQFLEQIGDIEDLRKEMDIVMALAKSTLDDATVNAFIAYANEDLGKLPSPEDILDAKDFKSVAKNIEELSKDGKGMKRTDRLSTICTRMLIHLKSDTFEPSPRSRDNLVEFMLLECIPKDLTMGFYMDIMREASQGVKEMTKDKRLATLLLDSL
jgi:hypothetical protein